MLQRPWFRISLTAIVLLGAAYLGLLVWGHYNVPEMGFRCLPEEAHQAGC